jgi:hypothetical protein
LRAQSTPQDRTVRLAADTASLAQMKRLTKLKEAFVEFLSLLSGTDPDGRPLLQRLQKD